MRSLRSEKAAAFILSTDSATFASSVADMGRVMRLDIGSTNNLVFQKLSGLVQLTAIDEHCMNNTFPTLGKYAIAVKCDHETQ